MATIENLGSPQCFAELVMGMSAGELMAQQMILRGAIHALTFLLTKEVTKEIAEKMLADSQECLCITHEVANERGLQLVGYN